MPKIVFLDIFGNKQAQYKIPQQAEKYQQLEDVDKNKWWCPMSISIEWNSLLKFEVSISQEE